MVVESIYNLDWKDLPTDARSSEEKKHQKVKSILHRLTEWLFIFDSFQQVNNNNVHSHVENWVSLREKWNCSCIVRENFVALNFTHRNSSHFQNGSNDCRSHSTWNEWIFYVEYKSNMLRKSGSLRPYSILINASENTLQFHWSAAIFHLCCFILCSFLMSVYSEAIYRRGLIAASAIDTSNDLHVNLCGVIIGNDNGFS